jgi:hypothetical protein
MNPPLSYGYPGTIEPNQPAIFPQPNCQCGRPSVIRTASSGPNQGRQWLGCANKYEPQGGCPFFAWADGQPGNQPSINNTNTRLIVGGESSPVRVLRDFAVELTRRFGHHTFRPGQRECVEAALDGRDVFCLMPTGGGKSMVYQVKSSSMLMSSEFIPILVPPHHSCLRFVPPEYPWSSAL